jgi:hypothetical protein
MPPAKAGCITRADSAAATITFFTIEIPSLSPLARP